MLHQVVNPVLVCVHAGVTWLLVKTSTSHENAFPCLLYETTGVRTMHIIGLYVYIQCVCVSYDHIFGATVVEFVFRRTTDSLQRGLCASGERERFSTPYRKRPLRRDVFFPVLCCAVLCCAVLCCAVLCSLMYVRERRKDNCAMQLRVLRGHDAVFT